MSKIRLLVGIWVLLGGLVVAQAQSADYYDVTVRKNPRGTVVVALGDLDGRGLPPTVITVLVFVVDWARTGQPTAPVTVEQAGTVLPVPLLLPAVGFALMHETPLSAVVRIGHLTVQTSGAPYTSSALLTLERASAEAQWAVTAVVVQ